MLNDTKLPEAITRCSETYNVADTLRLKPFLNAAAKVGRSSHKLNNKVGNFLILPRLCQQNRSVAVNQPAHKCAFILGRDFGPADSQAFFLRQPDAAQKVSKRFGAKVHTNVLAPILGCEMTVRDRHYQVHQLKIFRTDFNGVSIKVAVAPYQPDQPRKGVRPFSEKGCCAVLWRDCLTQACRFFAPSNRSGAHGMTIGNNERLTRPCKQSRTSTRTKTPRFVSFNALIWPAALLASVRNKCIHAYYYSTYSALCQMKSDCQSCHLKLDHADHIAHAKETRRRKIAAVQPALFEVLA